MKRELRTSVAAIVLFTLLLGLAYPLVMTGVAQVVFPGASDGSRIERDGKLVGSKLIAQDFKGDRRYFQSRPSQTGYTPDVTYFSNLGPNSSDARDTYRKNLRRYLARERRYNPGLTASAVPIDAATQSASGVDPQISVANANIQSSRIAAVRGLTPDRVAQLIEDHTNDRALGVFGEPGVNVLELNLALDDAQRKATQ